MFFAKYDINGERRIDENEKQKILDYLQGRNQENRQSGVTRVRFIKQNNFDKIRLKSYKKHKKSYHYRNDI